jgi:serine protease Do
VENKKSVRATAASLALLLGAVVFGMVLAGSLEISPLSHGSVETAVTAAPTGEGQVARNGVPAMPSFADLAEAVLPAVVAIRATTIESADSGARRGFLDQLEGLFGEGDAQLERVPREFRSDGAGSGFLISPDGWIATNNHVIEGATSVSVHLGERDYEAEVRGQDPATDIALLKIEAGSDLPFLTLGSAETLRVGDWVMAIGSPLSLGSSVTVGVVSAKGRSIRLFQDQSFESFIQTDAAINRGNSGGPLVETSGSVVGISTAMNFGAENIGFAVPVDILKRVLPQLRESGRVKRGYLGVAIDNLDYDSARAFGLESTDGALINSVVPNQPADRAGLRHGDVILRVGEHRVKQTRDLIDYVSALMPGSSVEIEVLRSGERRSFELILGERSEVAVAPTDEPEVVVSQLEWMGIELQEVDDSLRRQLGLPADVAGLLVTDLLPSSPLFDAGIRPGAILSEVNGKPIESVEGLEDVVATVQSGGYLRMYVLFLTQQGTSATFAIVRVP